MKPNRQLIPEALDQVKRHEAIRYFAYPDPASPLAKRTKGRKVRWGFRSAVTILESLPPELRELDGSPWTIGVGHTRNVKPQDQCDLEQVLKWLDEDLDEAQLIVEKHVKVPLNDYQYGALVSLVFNIGGPAFIRSTLLKKLNKGDYQAAVYHFGDFIKARDRETGQLVRNEGLYNRRQHEKAFFLLGAETASAASSPIETAAPETKTMIKDSGITVPATTGIAATGVAIGEAASKIEAISEYSETVKLIFICLTLAGVAVSLYLAHKRRKENT